MPEMTQSAVPRVVIIGAGFAGLNAAQKLAKLPVSITVVDRKNHHTFQPLLYQVALAVLSPAEIAAPVRAIFNRRRNVEVLLGEVTAIDLLRKVIRLDADEAEIQFDYLLIAAGATHAYFGHPEWEKLAPGLKTLEDALEIRRRVLLAFEEAESATALHGKHPMLNFVVIGAGPTGVELAGAISDIAKKYMVHDFRAIDPGQARVLLLEGGPRVLASYPEDLSASAEKQLRELGVEVRTHTLVTGIEGGKVYVGDEVIESAVTLWAAGVAASPLGRQLGVPTDRVGRVIVNPDLTVAEHTNVFVIGDLAACTDANGLHVPGVAPAAMQMGRFAARQIARDLKGQTREPFRYLDKGSLATIGRSKAVADFGKVHISGFLAWLAWSLIHVFFLIGFTNRFLVMAEWTFAYFLFKRSARLITDQR
jgi:NADH dehydrogenase